MDRLIPKPHRLVLIMGAPAVGKTTIAKLILEQMCGVYLDNNFFADPFSKDSRKDTDYLAVRSRLYEAIYRVALENLAVKNSVLLDMPHVIQSRDKSWKNHISKMSKITGAKLRVLRCVCSADTLRTRMIARGEPRDRWKIKNWELFLQQEPIKFKVPFRFLDINTEQNLTGNVSKAMQYIAS
jgi:predicted kinase